MPTYKLLLTATLAAVLHSVATTANADTPVSATKKDRSMNSSNDQNAPLTEEQFEAAAIESEALYKRGDNTKAATIVVQLMERVESDHARELVAMMLFSYPVPPELALRVARAANGNEQILDELLKKTMGLISSETVKEIVALRNRTREAWLKENKALNEAEALYERGKPTPEAEATLIQIIETTRKDEMRTRAVWVLCKRRLRPELALRIAHTAKDSDIYFALLSETAALSPTTVRELMTWIVMHDYLDTNTKYSKAAKQGRIPDDFVPSVFPRASEGMRHALLVMANAQLGVRSDERLHRFMVNVIYGDYSHETRDGAGLYLENAYHENNALMRDRFRIDQVGIQRFFGSVPEFIPRLMALLRHPRSLGESSQFRQHVTYAFSEADPSVAPAFFAEEAATHKLVRALLASIGENNYPQDLRDAMLKFLSIVGPYPHWRNEVATGLFKIAGRKNDEAPLDAAVNALATVPDHIDLTEADPKKDGTIGDRLADRVGQMVVTSPVVMLKLAREFHKIKINDHARQRILAQLLAVSLTRHDDKAFTAVMELMPSEVTNRLLAYNLACGAARQKDRAAMLKYTKLALSIAKQSDQIDLGKLSDQFRADSDFAMYQQDIDFAALLNAAR